MSLRTISTHHLTPSHTLFIAPVTDPSLPPFTLHRLTLPLGATVPHLEAREEVDQCVLVLDGALEVSFPGGEAEGGAVGEGGVVAIPRGVTPEIATTSSPTTLLLIHIPHPPHPLLTLHPTPLPPALPLLIPPATHPSHKAYHHVQGLWVTLLTGAQTHGYTLFDRLQPVACGAGAHAHDWTDEVFYIIDGEVAVTLYSSSEDDDGTREWVAKPGEVVFIPRGVGHSFAVQSGKGRWARFLNLHTPAGFEEVLRAVGQETDRRQPPGEGWKPKVVKGGEGEVGRVNGPTGLRGLMK